MTTSKDNDLKNYIMQALQSDFDKIADNNVSVAFYRHRASGRFLTVRTSSHRNDEVYRLLKGRELPNLPQIYEVCSDESGLIVLEEYVDGISLLEEMNGCPLSMHRACHVAFQICEALNSLHALGVIHRDIKPSNIILRPDDTAVLIDLSIARMISDRQDHDTQNLGTIGYAAPEQFGLSQSGQATDISALGVLLHVMLTGAHPTIAQPKNFILRHIVSRCVTVQMSRRYASARQVQKALKLFV